MANPYYNASGVPSTSAFGYSAAMRGEFANIAAGFALLPATLTANKAVIINSGGTGMTVSTGSLTLNGDLTVATGKSLTANSTMILGGTDGATLSLGGNLTTAAGKTVSISNTLTFTGTDGSSVAFGAGGTVLYSGGAYASSITGTANEITASAATGAVTLSLPAALTFTGKTVTGGTFASPSLTTPALGTPSSGVLSSCTSATLTLNDSSTKLVTTAMLNGSTLFSAYLSANINISSTGYYHIAFDSTVLNVGSCFNTGSFQFTAPWAGWYQFDGAVGIAGGTITSGEVVLDFQCSGAPDQNLYHTNPTSGFAGMGGTRLVKLAAGATVFLRIYSGAQASYTLSGGNGSGACFFSGRWVGA